ncbi:DUF6745 domain-containing protein [Nocardia sp. bgisy134]|uniref:DUF6745 domain-containing protein n=1 Tax=Nocardia sp. bgisy134 TaxID=3413789 RepID=UPI003D717A2F
MLSTTPADRPAAEAAISLLYESAGLSPPRFRWVSSPLIALTTGEPGLSDQLGQRWRGLDGTVPQALWSDVAADLPRAAQMPGRLFEMWVATPLLSSWSNYVQPILDAAHGRRSPLLQWNTRFGIGWIPAWSDVRYGRHPRSMRLWDALAATVRACGPWWWPDERLCIVSDPPETLLMETAGDHDEMRPHCADGPAVRFRDGWELYFWHGTRVPEWVITDPTAAAIDRESNVEVRRCAIERLGWPAYLEQAGMRLMATAPDPGNPGFDLLLYDLPRNERVLVAVNGSVERDGTRRRYGLTVPGHLDDPLAAAAWTYGLSRAQYSQLLHRT